MTRFGIIVGANLMFAIFCLPVITIGPSLAALYYVMLRTLRTGDALNPFKEFWDGFRMNFRQGILCFLGFVVLAGILLLDIRFCSAREDFLSFFRYPCMALLFFLIVEAIYLFPVMAAFRDTVPHLLRNALFFASRRPLKILPAAALHVIPVAVTVLDSHMRPLYGFLWATCAAGLIAMLVSGLLIRDFEPFLPEQKEDMPETAPKEKSDRQIRREMRKLDK